MTPEPTDDRERERIRAFWKRVEAGLRTYARHSAVRLLHLTNREGVYLVVAAVVLLGLAALASSPAVPEPWQYLLCVPAAYYVLDAMLVNTTITFISQKPIHELRSVLLTLLNVANVGLAYAVIYAAERESFEEPLNVLQAVYFSFVTLTTLGYGDIRPEGAHAWAGQVTVILELVTALYLLAAVLTVVVSWAQRRG